MPPTELSGWAAGESELAGVELPLVEAELVWEEVASELGTE